MVRATVLGAGSVGLATAGGLAARGHEVEIIEVREDRLAMLLRGELPIHEPGLARAFAHPDTCKRLRFSSVPQDGRPDVVFVCVGTAEAAGNSSDLSALKVALGQCQTISHSGVPVVVRSTVPPGLSKLVAEAGLARSRVFANPEFLRQGRAFEDFTNPGRVVIGTFAEPDATALGLVVDLLSVRSVPLLVVTIEEAELIKTASNSYLALRLAFINEVAMLCEVTGADVGHVLEGLKLDPRIGQQYTDPGFGFGGSCLPKDVASLASAGAALGLDMHVMAAVSVANEGHMVWFARRVIQELPAGCLRVALLGLAFKAGTDDVRGSPSLRLSRLLVAHGVEVVGYDPLAGANAKLVEPELGVVASPQAAVAGAGAAVVCTEWEGFRALEWGPMLRSMRQPVVLDGRRLLDPLLMRSLGCRYLAVGSVPPSPLGLGPSSFSS